MKRAILYILILAALAGCVKKTEWPLSGSVPGVIVVDGTLTDEVKKQSVRINYPVGNLNDTPVPVTGANVVINNEDSTWQLTEDPAGSGIYTTKDDFSAMPGKNYTLLIFYKENVYSAKASMIPGAVFDPLHYVKDDGDDLYQIDFVASTFNTGSSAMWEVLLDWSKVPGYEHADSASCHKQMLFYTLPTLDVSEIFPPGMQEITFPAGTMIAERRYSLSADHAAFIRSLLLETNWQGGLFCSAPANVETNMSNGAVGFFGVCAVTEIVFTISDK
jgi:hypothetical protein